MSKAYGVRTKELRAVFSAAPNESLRLQAIYERMKADGVGDGDERNAIRDTLPWLIRCGFLLRTGRGKNASYQFSGQGMRRVFYDEREALQRRQEQRRQRDKARRASRVGCQAGRIPKPVLAVPIETQTGETVDQFLARGGKVERLPTHWEQMERAA